MAFHFFVPQPAISAIMDMERSPIQSEGFERLANPWKGQHSVLLRALLIRGSWSAHSWNLFPSWGRYSTWSSRRKNMSKIKQSHGMHATSRHFFMPWLVASSRGVYCHEPPGSEMYFPRFSPGKFAMLCAQLQPIIRGMSKTRSFVQSSLSARITV